MDRVLESTKRSNFELFDRLNEIILKGNSFYLTSDTKGIRFIYLECFLGTRIFNNIPQITVSRA